jgi:hypothetical protein
VHTHTAEISPDPIGGKLVTCPEGCFLGTSAHAPTQEVAERRVRLHQLATTPLVRLDQDAHGEDALLGTILDAAEKRSLDSGCTGYHPGRLA